MPSTNEPILDLDDLHDDAAPKAVPAGSEDDPWGFPKLSTTGKKKKSKVKKKNVLSKQIHTVDQEDDGEISAYPVSITPSPPVHGVQLGAGVPVIDTIHESHSPPSGFDDEATAVEDVEALPSPKELSRPFPPTSPVIRSPRQAHARLVPAPSPPSRPARLSGAFDRQGPAQTYRQHTQSRAEPATTAALPRAKFVDPPPPHMPQAHFFGLPDLGFGFGQKQEPGHPAGSNGYCCVLDSLADAGDDGSAKKAKDALLVGSEGGLDVYRILSNKIEIVGRIEGLRGSVIGAKILPQTERPDILHQVRPLVILVIHGPARGKRSDACESPEDFMVDEDVAANLFSTTVEIFSLQDQSHVVTLFESMPVVSPSSDGLSADPEEGLSVAAVGRYITVSSAKSGEIYVFTSTPFIGEEAPDFRCIGKYWTTIQKSLSPPHPANMRENSPNAALDRSNDARPLYSLGHRWLVISPPASASTISVQGTPLVAASNGSPPGLSTHTAPPQPTITCEVAGTDIEGAWTRLSKAAAQGLFKYSQRGIEMGLQGWKELTHPAPPGTGRTMRERSSSKDDALFPPTKGPGEDPTRMAKEPALVSVIDLESLLQWEEYRPKHMPLPVATFALVDGCNFLSFSSSGTRMLTSSRKGEVSTVWDLSQVAHGVAKTAVGPTSGDEETETSPCVKQLHRIQRNTPSTIRECEWSRDDDAVAILTSHGTVHLHELPSRMTYRRKKRQSMSAAPVDKAEATVGLSSGLSPPSSNAGFLGSIKTGWQSVSTQVSSIRTTNPASAFGIPTTFAGFREATAAAGTAGSRAVAKGLSQGYTAAKGGASDYWHADDNKIRHKALQDLASASSLRWMRKNNAVSLAIVCGGTVFTHHVQRVTRRKGDEVVTGLRHERYAQKTFPLPAITTKAEVDAVSCAGQGPHGFWILRQSSPPLPQTTRRVPSQSAKVAQAPVNDVETNPPYCPFHADSRVNIYAYAELEHNSQIHALDYEMTASYAEFVSRGHDFDDEVWTFGEPLPTSMKMNDYVTDEFEPATGLDAEDESDAGIRSMIESKLTIHNVRENTGGEIRINTHMRRTKGANRARAEAGTCRFRDDDDDDDDYDDGMV